MGNNGIVITGGHIVSDAIVAGESASVTKTYSNLSPVHPELFSRIQEIENAILSIKSINNADALREVGVLKSAALSGRNDGSERGIAEKLIGYLRDANIIAQFSKNVDDIIRHFCP